LAKTIKVCAIAMPKVEGQKLADLSGRLPFPHVVLLPNVGNLPSAWVSPRDVGGALGLEIKKNLLLDRNRIFKRVSEIALCIPLLLLCVPLLAFLGLLVYMVSPGKIFFSQVREGLNGRSFRMFKLRTMYPDAEARLEKYLHENPEKRGEWERCFKLQDDPRILPVIGKILRSCSLDELPQLFNVLRGDMSLVGPRPFPYYHLDFYPEQFRVFRRSVRPGWTGLWQGKCGAMAIWKIRRPTIPITSVTGPCGSIFTYCSGP
jgi:lipopolysaccharide/colanic/teichoic acid biosynthesis glycosyltransferase